MKPKTLKAEAKAPAKTLTLAQTTELKAGRLTDGYCDLSTEDMNIRLEVAGDTGVLTIRAPQGELLKFLGDLSRLT